MKQEDGSEANGRRSYWGLRGVALAFLILGLIVLYQTFQIRQGGGYSAVGPQAFPLAVSIGLLLLSVVFLLRTTVFPDTDLAEQAAAEEAATHWPTVGLLALLLVIYVYALGVLGYVIATALFVAVCATLLRWNASPRILGRDLLIGLVLAAVIYFSFTRFLGVRLPAGLLDLVM
jgi:putative tricarboxylic transport membrane protein